MTEKLEGSGQMSHEALSIWTIYDHPRDRPDQYIARRFEIVSGGARATDDTIESPHLHLIRESLILQGLTPINRSPGDDPNIIESWL